MLEHREDPIGNLVWLVIRTGPHQIKIGGEVPGSKEEEIIIVEELDNQVDLVDKEGELVDIGEVEEKAAWDLLTMILCACYHYGVRDHLACDCPQVTQS